MPPTNSKIPIFEKAPGTMRPRKIGVVSGGKESEETFPNWIADWAHSSSGHNALLSQKLYWLDARQQLLRGSDIPSEEEVRAYTIPLSDAFLRASRAYPQIAIDPDVMAGSPCIMGTRIPVYMILDAVEHYGSLEGALKSYPRLTLQQVKDAVGFAKLVVECPIEHEDTVTP
ncbi:MAG TPA: DUF433 domain-containing protein [Bryobacteraceae bacterium]|nr:DUF433 domain-containing protein [Bryobacteraceae bacterium]